MLSIITIVYHSIDSQNNNRYHSLFITNKFHNICFGFSPIIITSNNNNNNNSNYDVLGCFFLSLSLLTKTIYILNPNKCHIFIILLYSLTNNEEPRNIPTAKVKETNILFYSPPCRGGCLFSPNPIPFENFTVH